MLVGSYDNTYIDDYIAQDSPTDCETDNWHYGQGDVQTQLSA